MTATTDTIIIVTAKLKVQVQGVASPEEWDVPGVRRNDEGRSATQKPDFLRSCQKS